MDGTFYFLLLDDYLIGTFEDSLIVWKQFECFNGKPRGSCENKKFVAKVKVQRGWRVDHEILRVAFCEIYPIYFTSPILTFGVLSSMTARVCLKVEELYCMMCMMMAKC